MKANDFASLEVSRYRLSLRARDETSLPHFLGSTLRGAFGHALKEAVCVMTHRDCHKCLVVDRCIYPYLFETPVPAGFQQLRGQQQAPHPFILTPPLLKTPLKQSCPKDPSNGPLITAHHLADGRTVRLLRSTETAPAQAERHLRAGEALPFELLLMAGAIDYLPYVVSAVSQMARRGLGARRARFELAEVIAIDENGANRRVYSNESKRITLPEQPAKGLDELISSRLDLLKQSGAFSGDTLKLRFLTPARIRVGGDLQAELSFELLVRNLLRRLSLLVAVHGAGRLELDYRKLIEVAAGVKTRRSDLRWHDWERYSNRQKEKMSLGGFVGEVGYAGGAIKQLLPLIIVGEIMHVGAGTSFGLGKYEVVS